MRIYFIDGPAARRSSLSDRAPRRLQEDGEHYRRVWHLRSTTFYRAA